MQPVGTFAVCFYSAKGYKEYGLGLTNADFCNPDPASVTFSFSTGGSATIQILTAGLNSFALHVGNLDGTHTDNCDYILDGDNAPSNTGGGWDQIHNAINESIANGISTSTGDITGTITGYTCN